MSTNFPQSVAQEIDKLCELRTAAHPILTDKSPAYKSLIDQTVGFLQSNPTGGLQKEQKVMMFMAVHLVSGTDQQVEWAVSAAKHVGFSDSQVREVFDLAILTGGGEAVSRVQFGEAVLQYVAVNGVKTNRFQF